MTDWNRDDPDPDAVQVRYDLIDWDFDQQAELASALAEAEIPHGWEDNELVVPEEFEQATDSVFADVEQRLDVMGKGVLASDQTDAFAEVPAVAALEADETLTEYDLGEWQELERSLVGDSLLAAGIPFRWEGAVLLVATTDEGVVDGILDDVESGDIIPVINDGPDGDELPFESLSSFFLAGERLRKDPRDADGLERLLDALKIADPNRPPRGVELRVWRQTCALAEQLADALVAEVDPDDIVIGDDDFEAASKVASDLHDLLRPLI